jgi:hypothetical protein
MSALMMTNGVPMKRRTINWVANDGTTIKATDTFARAFLKRLRELGMTDLVHVRVGRFAVTTVRKGYREMLFVGEIYSNKVTSDGSVLPGSKYWDATKRDRLMACNTVAGLITGHPLEVEVRKDLAAETAFYNR